MKKMVDGVEIEMTLEEIEAFEASRAVSPEMLQHQIVQAVQQRLDSFARTRNYDGILSAATYATSTVPQFATEGQYAVEIRDLTWANLYQMLEDVQDGIRPIPSGYDDIAGDLPALVWPE